MPGWYDIINKNEYGHENRNDIFESSKLIHQIINKAENIVPTNKIFLVGFSQGGVIFEMAQKPSKTTENHPKWFKNMFKNVFE